MRDHTQSPVHRPSCSRVVFVLAAALMLLPAAARGADVEGLSAADRLALPTYFGFGPLETFRIEHGISLLRPADFNGDGRTDLVLANNAKSTLEVLLQRESPPEESEPLSDVNELASHWRFERKPVSVRWNVQALEPGDVNGDGKIDLVLFGDPRELVVMHGKGDGTFEAPIVRTAREGLGLSSALGVGDLNADGRADVALLASSAVLVFFQREDGALAVATRFAHALDDAAAMQLADLDGDERLDLVLLTSDDTYPVYVRFQDSLGQLGPLQRIKMPAIRTGEFAKCLDRRATDLFGVERVSGRLKRWSFSGAEGTEVDRDWAVLYFPIPGETGGETLPLGIGDVDGDGQRDLVTASVESAQLVLFRQNRELGLLPTQIFGGQIKMRDLRCFDVDGNGADEVYVLSAAEEFIARSTYTDDRLTFPEALPTTGQPQALDVGPLVKDGPPQLVYVAKVEGKFQLVIQPAAPPAGAEQPAPTATVPLPDLKDPPDAVRLADVNRDGRNDVLVFSSFAPLTALLQSESGAFALLGAGSSAQQGLVKQATIGGYAFTDADGDGKSEVLLAQKAFVRALHVTPAGAWEVLDQYNAPGADAELTGLAAVRIPGHDRPYLAMYDKRGREVHVYKPAESGTFDLERSVPVGNFDLKFMGAAPLAGPATARGEAILLADKRRVALVLPFTSAGEAEERGVYESSIRDGRLMQMAVGDLNHDGRTDVAVLETNDHFVEVLTFGPDESLVRATKFKVFARKQYRDRGMDVPEPRSIMIADVTGDTIDDLILIAHDRILLYPGQ